MKKANDAHPNVQDEIALAEMVARMKVRGLRPVHGPAYVDLDGREINREALEPGFRACALGAFYLEDWSLTIRPDPSAAASGFEQGVTRSYGYRPADKRSYAVGAAFDDAMGEDEPFVAPGWRQL